ncbi:ATP-binding cassette domain-containing protein [Algibacter pacificus]|uniref:ATP-binding cassette domain-containing protein n=1 Tax=Algibacter pacificus TaxID=2599389 RepID=UPI0011C76A4F|nr:ATP-binding cassette domain-containing protein [Algibacter pacificus]
MKHIAIYCSNTIDKKQLIQHIEKNFLSPFICKLTELQGEVYSSITIDKFINEAYKHDKIFISTDSDTTFEEMSSGQQRIALAKFIFKQNPDYVIIDDICSNVDKQTLSMVYKLFEEYLNTCLYIQIFSRINDILPYVSQVIEIDNVMGISNVFTQHEFLLKHTLTDVSKKNEYTVSHLLSEVPYFDPLVTMQNVTVAYRTKPVLHKVKWTIKAGEFWELRGPIGSGKSTLLSMIIGDNPKAYGQDMHLFGRKKESGESVWEIKKHIGYFYPKMMQLFNRETSIENMIISGFYDSIGLYIKPLDWQRKVAKEWMENLGIDYNKKNFHELSPGQQRIILIIRAIVKQPPLIILDEPTVGLDDYNISLFVSIINAIAQTKKIAIIFVSHRKEVGLQADYLFELQPTEYGSISKITKLLT